MRHVLRCALLCLVLTGMTVVAPTTTLAVSHTSPIAAEHASARVATHHTFHLDQPAAFVATYWRGNSAAHVHVAFSKDGVHFTGPVRPDTTSWAPRVTTASPMAHSAQPRAR